MAEHDVPKDQVTSAHLQDLLCEKILLISAQEFAKITKGSNSKKRQSELSHLCSQRYIDINHSCKY